MRKLVDPICEVLTIEAEAHEQLYELSVAKKEAIIQNDISALDDIVKKEQVYLARMRDCERKRRVAVLAMAAELSRPVDNVSLSDFVDAATPEQAQTLADAHKKLSGLLLRQKELNEINRRLIESRLEFINYSLSTVAEEADASQIYHHNRIADAHGKTTKINMIDRKV